MNETINEIELNDTSEYGENIQGILTLDSLDISSIDIKATNLQDSIEANVNSYNIPQNHGRGFLSYFKRGRTIGMTVYIRGENETEFLKNLDDFRKACFKKNAILDWKRDGKIRRIRVNCTSQPQDFQHYNITFLRIDVNFASLEPFWYEKDYQSTNIFAQTGNFKEEISTIGTAQSDVIAYIIFATSDSTELKMKIGENEIIVDHDFDDGDILKIDGESKRVIVGETEIDYDGTFPFMEAGANFFDFTINGAFNCDVLILNKKSYV